MAGRDPTAFAAIKSLLRGTTMARIRASEAESIRRFVDIWYSPATRKRLEGIQIRR